MRFHRFTASKSFFVNGEWQVRVTDHWRLITPSETPVFFTISLEDWMVENCWHNQFINYVDGEPQLEKENW